MLHSQKFIIGICSQLYLLVLFSFNMLHSKFSYICHFFTDTSYIFQYRILQYVFHCPLPNTKNTSALLSTKIFHCKCRKHSMFEFLQIFFTSSSINYCFLSSISCVFYVGTFMTIEHHCCFFTIINITTVIWHTICHIKTTTIKLHYI